MNGKPQWRIYYGDGSTWSDQDGLPEHAPAENVQVVVSNDSSGVRGLQYGHEWYWFIDNLPYSGSAEDLHDHLMADHDRRVHGVKKARSITTQEFNEIVARAAIDPDFPLPD